MGARGLANPTVIRMKNGQTKTPGRMAIRWGSLIGAIIMAALYLHSSIYSARVSGDPQNDSPEAWAHRALMHLCFSGAILLLVIAIFRIAGSYPRIVSNI